MTQHPASSLRLAQVLALLDRLEALGASPAQLDRAASIPAEELADLVGMVERWPWLLAGAEAEQAARPAAARRG